MHELSLLEGVLSIIEDNADTQGYTSVKKVCLEIGALSCVEPEACLLYTSPSPRDRG